MTLEPSTLEPLTDAVLDEAIAFLGAANPFSQRTWGWDTGRFIDWRWGNNTLRDAVAPGFFERHGSVVRRSGEIVGLVLAEVGSDDHCILTADRDGGLVGGALAVAIDRHDGPRFVCMPSDEAMWLHEVLRHHGFERGDVAGLEWEFDVTSATTADPAAGYAIDALSDDRDHDFAGIDRCLRGAFGGDRDRIGVLRSLETSPMFRPELNVVARAGDGSIAAYCRGTVDPATGVCGIDPVGVHPEHQRKGLGRAVVLACFAAQRRLGGTMSFIGSAPEGSAGSGLYRSLDPVSVTSYSEWTTVPG